MPPLDAARIAAAALAVADARGAAGFTVKAVAERLGVTPMALYHHVENKKALVALMADRAIAEHPLPPLNNDGWREGLLDLARWTRDLMLAHPAMSRLHEESSAWTASALAVGEQWMGLWLRSGLEVETAVEAAILSSVGVLGVARAQSLLQDFTPPSADDLAFLPNARAIYGTRLDPVESFDLLVTTIVDGLCARLSAESETSRSA